MKTDKRTQLLKILSDASQSISSAALANMLGTSERTVRNYIKAINEEGKAVITSSREGYRLESHTASLDTLPNEAESRVWKVLSDLLTSKEGASGDQVYRKIFPCISLHFKRIVSRKPI